ncbi:Glycosyltransferase 28 domain-containing protein [Pelosinus sp. UFO1]|nr:Glycosyltransferase 28 domain-containing protein [Pelosinus sp. UFO1]
MGTGTVMGQTMRVVAIAKALQRRGHEVKFLASDQLIPIIKDFGIDVIEIVDMPQFDTFGNQANDSRHKEEQFNKMEQLIARIGEIETKAATREQPDLLLCGTISGSKIGKCLGIPSLLVALQAHGPKTLAMFAQRLKGIKDELYSSQEAADLIILEGMPEISGGVSFGDQWENYEALQDKIYFTGPLLNESPNEMPSRETLKEKHIGAGNKTMVYVTIGGGSSLIGEQFLQLVLESLKMLPWLTGVVATGIAISPDKIKSFNPPNNVAIRGFVPGTEMIKASDVTVFHGGSSTLMTCLACGTPAVVIPSIGEQEDNAAVLAQSGAGIVLDKKTLTPQMLADAVHAIVTDPSYREQAQKLKSLGEKYGGAEVAASLAEKLVAREAVLQ